MASTNQAEKVVKTILSPNRVSIRVSRLGLLLALLALVGAGCRETGGASDSLEVAKARHFLSYAGPVAGNALGRLGKGAVNAVSYSPDGAMVVVGSEIGIIAYSSGSFEELWSIPSRQPVISLAISPDGYLLAAGLEDGTATLIDLESQAVIEGAMNNGSTGNGLNSLAWNEVENSGDGRQLAMGFNDGSVIISSALRNESEAGRRIQVALAGILDRQSSGVISLAFSPNGRVLVTGARNGSISVWETDAWQWIGFLEGHEAGHGVTSLAWSDDGGLLLSGGRDRKLILWDMTTLQPRFTSPESSDELIAVGFNPNGDSMHAFSADGTSISWPVKTPDGGQSTSGNMGGLVGVARSPEGEMVVSAGVDGALHSWRVTEQNAIAGPQETLLGHSGRNMASSGVTWAPGGDRLASVHGQDVLVWDLALKLPIHRLVGNGSSVSALDWSYDARLIASADSGGAIRIWDAETGHELHKLEEHPGVVTDVGWSPDGQWLASAGSLDDSVVVVNSNTREVAARLRGNGTGIWSLGWTPDSEILSAGTTDGFILSWQAGQDWSGEPLPMMRHHLNWVSGIAYSPNGQWLATSGADNRIALHNLEDDSLYTYPGHSGAVRALAFSPDGQQLVSGARDGLVIIWNMTNPGVDKEPAAIYAGHNGGVNDVRWSPDGRIIASASEDGTVLLWPRKE